MRLAGVGGWRSVDFSDRPSQKQALADEFGEAQRRHGEAMKTRRDAQQHIGDHGGEDLQADGVFVPAEELADAQMLLDPAKQQFDLPAALVEGGDFDGGARQIVGDECERSAFVAFRRLSSVLAGQPNSSVGVQCTFFTST